MKNRFVQDLKPGDDLLDEPLMMKDMVRRTTKDNRPYILCTLGDRTGQVAGVFWDVPERINDFIHSGQVLFVTGKVTKYKDSLQISISDVYPHEKPDLTYFLPSSARSREEMVTDLRSRIEGCAEPYQSLLKTLLLDEKFLIDFSNSPAAKSMHHASVGGLLEHTLSMAEIADHLGQHYPNVDRDLLMTGVLLHDMGKVWEYNMDGEFGLSEDGQLVGHITRAAIVIEQAAKKIEGFPGNILREILHLIVSHHGTLEWGSPVKPKTLEAILLHQIDLLDSRIQGYFDYLEMDSSDSDWTTKRSPMHDSFLRRPVNLKK